MQNKFETNKYLFSFMHYFYENNELTLNLRVMDIQSKDATKLFLFP